MSPDHKGIRAVFTCPGIWGEARIYEVEDLIGEGISLQTYFCCCHGIDIRRIVNGSVRYGRELNAVFFIEDNAVYCIRKIRRANAVKNRIADCYFSAHGFAECFGFDDPREPQNFITAVDFASGTAYSAVISYIEYTVIRGIIFA